MILKTSNHVQGRRRKQKRDNEQNNRKKEKQMKKTINKNFRKTNKATVHIVKKVEDILYRAALSCSKKGMFV